MDEWKILDKRVVYSGAPFLEVSLHRVELPDGRVVDDYHQIWAGTFATTVPETEDGTILFIRQYRHGIRRVALTFPGGRMDKGEAPQAAAARELLEETGYEAREWIPLGEYPASCTYGLAHNHYFHARGARKVREPAQPDIERGAIVLMDRERARRALVEGEIASTGHAFPLALVLGGLEET